jgi:hypothetical protein
MGLYNIVTCGLYYKHIMIVNSDSSFFNKLHLSLITDDARVVIYASLYSFTNIFSL